MLTRSILAILLSLSSSSLLALEGKWTPGQVLEIDPAWLLKEGLELPVGRLWDRERGTGLLSAAISVSGCSAAFVSAEGLFVTNHHCLFGIVQEHSSGDRDLITAGFLAKSRGGELPSKVTRVTVPRRFTDVTREMVSAGSGAGNDEERARLIATKGRALVESCERSPDIQCKVATFDGGLQYVLIDTLVMRDVRLVYAPPRAIGEYGGEIDNWTWPRHTGDFAVGRVYAANDGKSAEYAAANIPFRPEFYFPISRNGVRPGDFIMVMGYPGVTYRSLIAEEMEERRDLFFPRREEVFGEWIRIIEAETGENAETSIRVASDLKSLLNRYKNAQGQLAGFRRGSIAEKQKAADQAIVDWSRNRNEFKGAIDARKEMAAISTEQRATWERDFLLGLIQVGAKALPGMAPPLPKALHHAVSVAHLARERAKPDAQRESDFGEKDLSSIRDKSDREEKNYVAAVDEKLFVALVKRMLDLPAGQRIEPVDRWFGSLRNDAPKLAARVRELYSASRLLDGAQRNAMLAESETQLHARRDPIVELGFDLDLAIRDLRRRQSAWDAKISRLRPAWRRAVIAHAGGPVAPDANSTLRVSFGHVQGYEPRDGVFFKPFTTLGGVIEKHTGTDPFDVPRRVREAAAKRDFGEWAEKSSSEVPVNFLADADTTGGNSGSPVVNGRGELVGINFDRVWENVANDFGFNPAIARNISVEIRYLLWMLDRVEHADALLEELGIAKAPADKN